ncbi:MAG: hypothetical protein H3C39_03310 [Flavobacteriia bacterium]|nr:hypothetical protein [Flavobacteriia bacterium]
MKTKNLLMIAALLFSSAVFTFSCKSDDDGGGGGGAGSGEITAKVDGTTVTTIELTTAASNANGNLMILGNDGGQNPNKAFTMTIVGFDGPGTYPVGGGANIFNVCTYTQTDASNPSNPVATVWSAPYDDNQVGEIKVSEVTSTYVKGTFSFKGKDQEGGTIKNVTEGSFNVKFMSLP